MHDAVGEVLAQRKALDRGAAAGVAISLLLHGAITAAAVYAALRHPAAEESVPVIQIKFAPMPPAPQKPAAEAAAATPAPPQPKPQPVVPPAPVPAPVVKPVAKPVAASPFGKSTKKATPTPPAPQPPTANSQPSTANPSTAAIPVGGAGAVVEGDFPYSIYIDRMTTLVGHHWGRPEVAPGLSTTVKFVIDRDGTIHDAVMETPSGNGTFDRAALRAVIETAQLPPLPFGFNGTYLNVHLTFK